MKKLLIFIMFIFVFFVASCDGLEGIQDVNVEKIYLDSENVKLYVDEVYTMEYSVYPTNANLINVVVETSNDDIACYNGNRIEAKREGSCEITFTNTYNGVTAVCKVTVSRQPTPHNHSYNDFYSYDEDNHWRYASCEHTTEYTDKGKHTFTLISKTLNEGKTEYTIVEECTVCQYQSTRKEEYTEVNEEFNVFVIEQTGSYGDGTLFKLGDFEILVDGGTEGSATELKRVLQENVTDGKIELLVSSHAHTDHYGALESTNQNTLWDAGIKNVDYIIDSGADAYGSSYTSTWIESVRKFYVSKGATYIPIQTAVKDHHDDAILPITDNLSVQFFNTNYYVELGAKGNGNANSVAMVVRYNNYNFFTFGDLPTANESGVLGYSDDVLFASGTVNFFKASHHGSKGANSANLLKKLKPNYSYASSGITSGSQSTSGPRDQHPYMECVNRIINQVGSDNFYWNGTNGTINIKINGDNVTITGAGRKAANYYYQGQLVPAALEKDLPFAQTKWYQTLK